METLNRTYYVYELYDMYGNVVYVGQTCNPAIRYRNHVHHKSGLFRANSISMHIVKSFNTRREALQYEGILKLEYGFEWTEKRNMHIYRTNFAKPSLRKLTSQQVEEIRSNTIHSNRKLAKIYNVSHSIINRIKQNKTYILN